MSQGGDGMTLGDYGPPVKLSWGFRSAMESKKLTELGTFVINEFTAGMRSASINPFTANLTTYYIHT